MKGPLTFLICVLACVMAWAALQEVVLEDTQMTTTFESAEIEGVKKDSPVRQAQRQNVDARKKAKKAKGKGKGKGKGLLTKVVQGAVEGAVKGAVKGLLNEKKKPKGLKGKKTVAVKLQGAKKAGKKAKLGKKAAVGGKKFGKKAGKKAAGKKGKKLQAPKPVVRPCSKNANKMCAVLPKMNRLSGAATEIGKDNHQCVMCQFLVQRSQQDFASVFGTVRGSAVHGSFGGFVIDTNVKPAAKVADGKDKEEGEEQSFLEKNDEFETAEILSEAESNNEDDGYAPSVTYLPDQAEDQPINAEVSDAAYEQAVAENQAEEEVEEESEAEDQEEEEIELTDEEAAQAIVFLQMEAQEAIDAAAEEADSEEEENSDEENSEKEENSEEEEEENSEEESEETSDEEEESLEQLEKEIMAEEEVDEIASISGAKIVSESEEEDDSNIEEKAVREVLEERAKSQAHDEADDTQIPTYIFLEEESEQQGASYMTPEYTDAASEAPRAKVYAKVLHEAETEVPQPALVDLSGDGCPVDAAKGEIGGIKPVKPKKCPNVRITLVHTPQRFRHHDVILTRPSWNRFSPYRAVHPDAGRISSYIAFTHAVQWAYDRLAAYCSTRLPEQFFKYCAPVLRRFRRISDGIRYGDRPETICIYQKLCPPTSYAFKRGPHDMVVNVDD